MNHFTVWYAASVDLKRISIFKKSSNNNKTRRTEQNIALIPSIANLSDFKYPESIRKANVSTVTTTHTTRSTAQQRV